MIQNQDSILAMYYTVKIKTKHTGNMLGISKNITYKVSKPINIYTLPFVL